MSLACCLVVTVPLLVTASGSGGARGVAFIGVYGKQKFFERGEPVSVYAGAFFPRYLCKKKIKFKLKDHANHKFKMKSMTTEAEGIVSSRHRNPYIGDIPNEVAFGPAKLKGKQNCGKILGHASDKVSLFIVNNTGPNPTATARATSVRLGEKTKLTFSIDAQEFVVRYLTLSVEYEVTPNEWRTIDVLGVDSPIVGPGNKSLEWRVDDSMPVGHYRFALDFKSQEFLPPSATADAYAEFLVGQGFGHTDLLVPIDGQLNPAGNLVVGSSFEHQLVEFDPGGDVVSTTEGFNEPKDVDFDDAGVAYVADAGEGIVVINGTSRTTIDSPEGFSRSGPVGISVTDLNGGRIWVADGSRVQAFSKTGQFQFIVEDPLKGPVDVTAAPDGTAWVADRDGATVFHLSNTGEVLGTLPAPGVTPLTVDMDADGRLWVGADRDEHGRTTAEVMVFDGSGNLITSFGDGLIAEATGIAVAGRAGDVYVIDRSEGEVVHLRMPL